MASSHHSLLMWQLSVISYYVLTCCNCKHDSIILSTLQIFHLGVCCARVLFIYKYKFPIKLSCYRAGSRKFLAKQLVILFLPLNRKVNLKSWTWQHCVYEHQSFSRRSSSHSRAIHSTVSLVFVFGSSKRGLFERDFILEGNGVRLKNINLFRKKKKNYFSEVKFWIIYFSRRLIF